MRIERKKFKNSHLGQKPTPHFLTLFSRKKRIIHSFIHSFITGRRQKRERERTMGTTNETTTWPITTANGDAILPDASGFVRFYETTFVTAKKNDDRQKRKRRRKTFAAILQPVETRGMVGVRRRRVLRRSEVL